MDQYLVRLKRFAPDRGQPHFTYYHAGIHFRADEYWKRVPEEAALYLKELHQRPGDLRSPLIFDVIRESELAAFAAAEDRAAWEAELASGRYPPGYFSKIGLTRSPYEKSQPGEKLAPMAPPAPVTRPAPASPPARREDPREDQEGELAEAAAEEDSDTSDDEDPGGEGGPDEGEDPSDGAAALPEPGEGTLLASPAGELGRTLNLHHQPDLSGRPPRASPEGPGPCPLGGGHPAVARGGSASPAPPQAKRDFGRATSPRSGPRQGPWPHPKPPA